MKIKNKLATLALIGASVFYSNNARSQDFANVDTLAYKGPVEYSTGLLGTELKDVVALDTNQNGICDLIIERSKEKKFLGKRILTTYIHSDFNENGIFDQTETRMKEWSFLGKEKGSIDPYINKHPNDSSFYVAFDGKIFDWKIKK